jgi:hypothetical protein
VPRVFSFYFKYIWGMDTDVDAHRRLYYHMFAASMLMHASVVVCTVESLSKTTLLSTLLYIPCVPTSSYVDILTRGGRYHRVVRRPVGQGSDRASEGDVRAVPRRRIRPEQHARGDAGASEVFARVSGLKKISSWPRRAARADAYPRVRSSDRSLRLALLMKLRELGPMTPSTYARTAVETILCVSKLEIEC